MTSANSNDTNTICLSVIVPAYNAAATIGRTLEALSKQNCSLSFEVIVVDDGSSDGTADIVRGFASVKYIFQDNAGPASARNHGAKLARGEYLAFTDSDCVPHEDWISQLMAGFIAGDDRTADRNVGAVAGSYGIANPEKWLARSIYKEILWRHTYLMPDFPNALGSYNFCVKKNVFDAIGGFNTAYRRASGEDNDLSYKIIRSGWQIYFQREALVDHYHTAQVVKYLKEQFQHGFWRVKMYKDHPQMMRPDGYTYWKDIIEVPLSACLLAGVFLSFLQYFKIGEIGYFLLLPFLVFEILCALIMTQNWGEGAIFGLVLFFRAFSRMLGFAMGFLLSCLLNRSSKVS